MFLSTEGFPQAHRILGIVNATSHLAMPTEAIDSFESMDQLFSDVQEKLSNNIFSLLIVTKIKIIITKSKNF